MSNTKMRSVPNDIVTSLLRHIPLLIDRIEVPIRDTKLHNAVRITKKAMKRLKKIEDESKRGTYIKEG